MTDDDALIAKAAEALWDSLLGKYKRGEFTECPEQHLPWWHERGRAVIAAVRDQIAAEALREAANASLLGQRGPRVSRDWLHARADRLDSVSGNVDEPECPECGEPQEVPGEGRYYGDCEDYEGHCINDHCMTCGRST